MGRYSFMDIFIPTLLIGLIYALCFIVGMLASASYEGGAATMMVWTFVAAAICGGVSGWIGFMMADMEFNNPRGWALGIGLLGAIVTAIPSVSFLINGAEIAAYHRAMAPKAQSYVLEHFDDFDRDHSGMIIDSELETAANVLPTAEGRQIAQYLRDEQSIAGHVIDSYTTTTWVWISTGNGGGYMSPVTTTTYIYGITSGDLQGWTARVKERYQRW